MDLATIVVFMYFNPLRNDDNFNISVMIQNVLFLFKNCFEHYNTHFGL